MLDQYREIIESLNSRRVNYVIIGGVGAILHGVPRMTFDLDILIEADVVNGKRLLDAFLDIRLGTAILTTPEELIAREVTIFNDRIRIDVFTKVPGLTFADAWAHREVIQYEGEDVPLASRSDIVASKLASGRPIDLDDVRTLDPGSLPPNDSDPS
jgi:hypothetical protein